MVRTKADRVPTKVVGGKAPHKSVKSTPVKKTSSGNKGKNYSGGNPYHPRETPEWQKPITSFLNHSSANKATDSTETQENNNAGSSKEAENESD